MKKSRSVAVVTVATLGMAIGCSSREEQAVCVYETRVAAPRLCETDRSGRYFWYYHSAYYHRGYPAVGSAIRAGGRFEPAGVAARGGFGATASGRSVSA
jgi:hypothetical protein